MLALLAFAELLGMSLWFTASALSPQLGELWSLDAGEVGWLTTVVQLGFVAGTACAAILNLADIIPNRRYFAISAVLAALANAAIAAAPGYSAALVLRFATGFFLAGVYPPAMKMIATWFRSGRGLAIGTIVGALTVGKGTPYLLGAFPRWDPHDVLFVTSAGALLAALLVAVAYRDGPFPFARRPFSWGLVGTVLRHRRTRLAIGGYLGHMWELYAMWSLITLFFYQFSLAGGATVAGAATFAGVIGFSVIGMGGIGAVLAGRWADRWGRERIAIWAMAVSGGCSLLVGWLVNAPVWMVVPIALVWGFTIVADSAQFSALVTEVSPKHAVGTALTLQTSLGFALTAGSIWLAVELSSRTGWGVAFSILALGPAFGILNMVLLQRTRFGGTDSTHSSADSLQVSSS